MSEVGESQQDTRRERPRAIYKLGRWTQAPRLLLFLQTWGLEYVAAIEWMSDNVDLAAVLVGAADAERDKAGGGWGPQTVGVFDVRTALAERFDEDRIEELLARGRLLDLTEAVEIALSDNEGRVAEPANNPG